MNQLTRFQSLIKSWWWMTIAKLTLGVANAAKWIHEHLIDLTASACCWSWEAKHGDSEPEADWPAYVEPEPAPKRKRRPRRKRRSPSSP